MRDDDSQIACPERKAPDAEARLTVFAKRLAKRGVELARASENLRAERDREIRAAHSGGPPEDAIARVMKLSQQRVSQILRG